MVPSYFESDPRQPVKLQCTAALQLLILLFLQEQTESLTVMHQLSRPACDHSNSCDPNPHPNFRSERADWESVSGRDCNLQESFSSSV